MATINYDSPDRLYTNAVEITWSSIGNADDGQGFEGGKYRDKTVHAYGTWGGATMLVEGSSDNTNWVTLVDPQGNAISKTADFVETLLDNTRYVRWSTSGGTGTDLTVKILAGKGY